MKNLEYYLEKANREGWAVPQFNFSDLSELKGIVAALKEAQSPAILGTSEGESNFFGSEEAVAIRNVLRKKLNLPLFLNLDHGKSFDIVKKAVDIGYDMVHFDGSKLSLEENIKNAKEVVKYCKWKGVLVEGEIGRIGTDSSKVYSEEFEIKESDLTDPSDAFKFVKETKVNLLAISIGTFHGIEASGSSPNLKIDLLKKIRKEISDNVFLVLHGGSGTPEEDVKKAIESGIVKVNINTELRVAYSKGLRDVLNSNPDEVVPYKFLPEAQRVVSQVVRQKIKLFGSADKI